MNITQFRPILEGVLHAVISSVDFLPNEDQRPSNEYPSVWDHAIPTWNVARFDVEQDKGKESDFLCILVTWSATIRFVSGREREISTSYVFKSHNFETDYGIHGLIMNFHDHVMRTLRLTVVPKE